MREVLIKVSTETRLMPPAGAATKAPEKRRFPVLPESLASSVTVREKAAHNEVKLYAMRHQAMDTHEWRSQFPGFQLRHKARVVPPHRI
jgi:hypothetical protein